MAEGPTEDGAEAASQGGEGTAKPSSTKYVHCLAYAGYYSLLFLAEWFGAKQLDHDGDGDFDAHDVEGWMKKNGVLGTSGRANIVPGDVPGGSANRERALRTQVRHHAKHVEDQMAAHPKHVTDQAETAMDNVFADKDGDGDCDMEDILGAETQGEAQEDTIMDNLALVPPYFMLFECTAVSVAWVVGAAIESGKSGTSFFETKGGLDTISPGMFDLRWSNSECDDLRPQIWRWFSYQFTHVGISHAGMNILLNIIMGLPLEGLHGWWRLAIMFNFGVFGGAMCFYISDAHSVVVGCSGGCYALLGIHFADLIMNWNQKKFRYPTLMMLLLLVGLDVAHAILSQTDGGGASHAAHLGGSLAGLAIGVIMCKNAVVLEHEKVVAGILGVLGGCILIFCFVWLGIHESPLNIIAAGAGETGWCSSKVCYHATLPAAKPLSWQCFRCDSKECIQRWTAASWLGCSDAPSVSFCDAQGWYYDVSGWSGGASSR